jgi:hypothetical protein
LTGAAPCPQFAASGGSPNAPTIAAMLQDAEGNFTLPNGQLDPVVAPPSHRISFTEVATSERVSHSSISSFNMPIDMSIRRVSARSPRAARSLGPSS